MGEGKMGGSLLFVERMIRQSAEKTIRWLVETTLLMGGMMILSMAEMMILSMLCDKTMIQSIPRETRIRSKQEVVRQPTEQRSILLVRCLPA